MILHHFVDTLEHLVDSHIQVGQMKMTDQSLRQPNIRKDRENCSKSFFASADDQVLQSLPIEDLFDLGTNLLQEAFLAFS